MITTMRCLHIKNVIACSYLEVQKDITESTICYIKQKKKAIISTYCVTGLCPTYEIRQEKHFESIRDMYLVTYDTNEAILGFLSKEIM